jgi:hypothetical protein
MCNDVQLCNRYVREFLIPARTWLAFGLPSKTECDSGGESSVVQRDLPITNYEGKKLRSHNLIIKNMHLCVFLALQLLQLSMPLP